MNTSNVWAMVGIFAVLLVAGVTGVWTLANALSGEEYVRKSEIHELVKVHAPYTADQEAIHTRLDTVDDYIRSLEQRVTAHQVSIGETQTTLALISVHLDHVGDDVVEIKALLKELQSTYAGRR